MVIKGCIEVRVSDYATYPFWESPHPHDSHNTHSKRDAADAARRRFLAPEGDHTTLLRVYAEYRSVSNSGGAKAVKEW